MPIYFICIYWYTQKNKHDNGLQQHNQLLLANSMDNNIVVYDRIDTVMSVLSVSSVSAAQLFICEEQHNPLQNAKISHEMNAFLTKCFGAILAY